MKINRQFQDLHSPVPGEIDWVTIQIVERDICLLYHQLADYSYIMSDLYYGDIFGLPYWEFLNIQNLDAERQAFIRNGCLVMLYAMALEILDDTGSYLTMDMNRFNAARKAVDNLPQFDHESDRLINAVRDAFKLIGGKHAFWENSRKVQKVRAESVWIHENFVRQYFNKRTDEFNSNPYYHKK